VDWVDEAERAARNAVAPKGKRSEAANERRLQVWRLRIQGWPYEDIARKLGVTNATVCTDLQWCMKNLPATYDTVADFRVVALRRLEDWIREADDISVRVKLLDTQAKLLGAYAPVRVDAGVQVRHVIVGVEVDRL
jgi:transcriptional regulator